MLEFSVPHIVGIQKPKNGRPLPDATISRLYSQSVLCLAALKTEFIFKIHF